MGHISTCELGLFETFHSYSIEVAPVGESNSLKRTKERHRNPISSVPHTVSHNTLILFSQTTASNQAGGITITFKAQEKLLETMKGGC